MKIKRILHVVELTDNTLLVVCGYECDMKHRLKDNVTYRM